jgi:mannose-1-phosphate guanylyltransferase
LEDAQRFFESQAYAWNPGYFVTTPKFILSQYEKFAPDLWKGIMEIQKAFGGNNYEDVLQKVYPTFEKISFDNAILEKIEPNHVFVIAADLGWSDVGAWEALKEALEETKNENVTRGKVLVEDSLDNLVFNYTDQLVVGIDLEKMIVINTDDVLLVCPKNSVPKIKKLVESLLGTPNENLT